MTSTSGIDACDSVSILPDGRISSKSSYTQIAVARLCSTSHSAVGKCALSLLCTKCGVKQTLRMYGVSRDSVRGAQDDTTMADELLLQTAQGTPHIVMPPVIVLDAVSIIRMSQREAVLPGAGLSGSVRPLQGPICTTCQKLSDPKSTLSDVEHQTENDADDEREDSPLLSPSESAALNDTHAYMKKSPTTAGFVDRHIGLIESIRKMVVTPNAQKFASSAGDVLMRTDCQCGDAMESKCANSYNTTMTKKMRREVLSDTTSQSLSSLRTTGQCERFATVFGHVGNVDDLAVSGVGLKPIANMAEDTLYEMCIVDTRAQRMCALSQELGVVNNGIIGQHNYFNPYRACTIAPVVAIAVPVSNIDFGTDNSDVPVLTTHVSVGVVASVPLVPPTKTSCFVCCTLLDEADEVGIPVGSIFPGGGKKNRHRHTNIYLPSHLNWAHKDCTVQCERNLPGICTGYCPRLNTFVSTAFDGSPRFENVCPSCMFSSDYPEVPAFSGSFSSPTFSSSTDVSFPPPGMQPASLMQAFTHAPFPKMEPASLTRSFTHAPFPAMEPASLTRSFTHTPYTTPSSPNNPNKRMRGPNWLVNASTLRKKAAVNAANSHLTKKEIEAKGVSTFPIDKSGVYTCKSSNTWYTLDSEGKNPGPVCGMPFNDKFFGSIRTWETLQDRERAMQSDVSLRGMLDM
jgi:hypothetical protein